MANFIPLLALVVVGDRLCVFPRQPAHLDDRERRGAGAGRVRVRRALARDAMTAIVFAAIAVPLNHDPTRRRYIVEPALKLYAR